MKTRLLIPILLIAALFGFSVPITEPFVSKPTSTTPVENSAKNRGIERGVASWYGGLFDGQLAADGEVYEVGELVAAHPTLPFGTIVRVTNLRNGKHVDVRIIDRGPFVEGRIIDLSLAAAEFIDMVNSGVARVKVEIISGRQHATSR